MRRILLIDTNEMESSKISLLLNTQMGDISTQHLRSATDVERYFGNGNEGSARQIEIPSLIIMDVDFPEAKEGLAILERIQRTNAFQNIPTFVFTNNTDKSIVANCYVRGANGYFIKPREVSSFQKSVQMLADRWQNIIQRGFGYNYKAV
jgi:CheY-like chemotaxis protein